MAVMIAVIVALTVLCWYIATFNSLSNSRTAIDQSWANIQVELKRRYELLSNLLEVVRGYAAHETAAFERVAARFAEAPRDAESESATEGEVESASKRLFALAEAYPTLRADEQFRKLSHNLVETENRIAERRTAYNAMVRRYEQARLQFPSKIVAKFHHFHHRSFFTAPEGGAALEQPPQISLPQQSGAKDE